MDIIFGSWKEQRRVCFCPVLQAKIFLLGQLLGHSDSFGKSRLLQDLAAYSLG